MVFKKIRLACRQGGSYISRNMLNAGIAQRPPAGRPFPLLARGRAVLWFSHCSLGAGGTGICVFQVVFAEEMLNWCFRRGYRGADVT